MVIKQEEIGNIKDWKLKNFVKDCFRPFIKPSKEAKKHIIKRREEGVFFLWFPFPTGFLVLAFFCSCTRTYSCQWDLHCDTESRCLLRTYNGKPTFSPQNYGTTKFSFIHSHEIWHADIDILWRWSEGQSHYLPLTLFQSCLQFCLRMSYMYMSSAKVYMGAHSNLSYMCSTKRRVALVVACDIVYKICLWSSLSPKFRATPFPLAHVGRQLVPLFPASPCEPRVQVGSPPVLYVRILP